MQDEVRRLVRDAATWRAVVRDRARPNHRLLEELERLLLGRGLESEVCAERIARAWSQRSFDVFYERPLMVIAALRFDALATGPEHPLWRSLGATEPDPDAISRAALIEALSAESVWESLSSRFIQTNEASRAVAWSWPAALAGCDAGRRPLALVEIGAAAGLNLVADRLPAIWTDQLGEPIPVVSAPRTVARVGIDRRPLDVRDDTAVLWMRACIWAGERQRLERFDAAVTAFRADPPELLVADAVEAPGVLERVAARVPTGGLVLAFQTIVRDYFDGPTDQAYERAMRGWLEHQRRDGALWVELEIDHHEPDKQRPTVLTAHVADGAGHVVDLCLARANYHPADLIVDFARAAELGALLAP